MKHLSHYGNGQKLKVHGSVVQIALTSTLNSMLVVKYLTTTGVYTRINPSSEGLILHIEIFNFSLPSGRCNLIKGKYEIRGYAIGPSYAECH